jgi:Uma2 family endonuclease
VLGGEAGVRLRRTADSTVGVDVVYIDAAMAAAQTDGTTLIDGAPVLAVEILSPNDTLEAVEEKTDAYLGAGVALVWVVNPIRRTVTVHRPGAEPVMLSASRELTGGPHLPGFAVAVGRLFE